MKQENTNKTHIRNNNKNNRAEQSTERVVEWLSLNSNASRLEGLLVEKRGETKGVVEGLKVVVVAGGVVVGVGVKVWGTEDVDDSMGGLVEEEYRTAVGVVSIIFFLFLVFKMFSRNLDMSILLPACFGLMACFFFSVFKYCMLYLFQNNYLFLLQIVL